MKQSFDRQRPLAFGRKGVARPGAFLVALVLAAFVGPVATAGAHRYYAIDQSQVTIQKQYNENGQFAGVGGVIKPGDEGGWAVCAYQRPVRLEYSLDDGGTGVSWTMTQGRFWGDGNATQPGTYRAQIMPEVRFQRINGKRRKILCTGARSPVLRITSFDRETP